MSMLPAAVPFYIAGGDVRAMGGMAAVRRPPPCCPWGRSASAARLA
ncbi:MAG: hypothetical protein U0636_04565 [Phycisphaerales bacterium]